MPDSPELALLRRQAALLVCASPRLRGRSKQARALAASAVVRSRLAHLAA